MIMCYNKVYRVTKFNDRLFVQIGVCQTISMGYGMQLHVYTCTCRYLHVISGTLNYITLHV